MSLCESVLEVLEQQAKTQNYQRVTKVYLEIGALSSVDSEAMRFCFDVVMKDSLAADAQLDIIEVPGKAWCFDCSNQVEISLRYDECPVCGGVRLQVNDGEQMRIKALEVA